MAQNSTKTVKPRGKGRPFQKGQSGNPGGRPKNEQSISYWLAEFGKMTPRELADLCETYAADLKKVKGDMPMFAHIAIRALMGQINEPSPGLFAHILDRTEGKVKDKLELSGDSTAPLRIVIEYDHPGEAAEPASGPAPDQA
jgi:hypothetical protein